MGRRLRRASGGSGGSGRSGGSDPAVDPLTGSGATEPPRVVVVTDSTASLPPGEAERWGIEVVPLEVGIGDARYREGVDLAASDLLAALTGGTRVTTSQPTPAAFVQAYARAVERGAREIVSVHLSGELSGTVGAAEVAALGALVPVHVVDSRSVAMGLGFAAMAAAEMADRTGMDGTGRDGTGMDGAGMDGACMDGAGMDGAGMDGTSLAGTDVGGAGVTGAGVDGAAVAQRARVVASSASALFLVDSLEHLRRGGRIGATAAAVGTVLGMRPMLGVRGGRVEVVGTVRTRRAARERLLALAVEEVAGRGTARVAVHHLGQPDLADALAAEVRERCGVDGEAVLVSEVSAVIGAHAGPGLLGVVVADA